jgi:hypothetical protein
MLFDHRPVHINRTLPGMYLNAMVETGVRTLH